jgi:hypothetical protein
MSDLVDRLTIDAACLRKMMAQADIAGPETGVRVKSPGLLLESIVEAAARIAALEKENAELRKALEPFANSDMAPDIYDDDSCVAGCCDFTCADLRRARLASTERTEG